MLKLVAVAVLAFVVWTWLKTPARQPRMPLAEARDLLGVGENAGADEIRAAQPVPAGKTGSEKLPAVV